jgi:hypothetical protein
MERSRNISRPKKPQTKIKRRKTSEKSSEKREKIAMIVIFTCIVNVWKLLQNNTKELIE